MPRTIEVTELILRDGHQSLLATRMALEDMVPACEDIDNAGFWSVECWGGATFDACIRFLNEDIHREDVLGKDQVREVLLRLGDGPNLI
jgi:methylmalonyl-CoA carboxyltransferase 5S subunit